jgi:hypothetical protein
MFNQLNKTIFNLFPLKIQKIEKKININFKPFSINKKNTIIMENINISKRYIFFYLRLKTIKKRKNTSYLDNSLILFKDLLNWYLIHKSIFLKGILSDKINSCFIVSRIISNNICKKTYNYYSNPSNISINNQILKFALKANHGSGQNILVNNSQNFKIDEIKNKIKRWLI